ncbi:MAG TPA: PPK2 family polyphosphate kinase [Woeseiaceae bacterium]|nr:PPK2 family polyphosphate kinase [Woeseiaceae bacterium]
MPTRPLFTAPESVFLVPFDGSFHLENTSTSPPDEDRRHPKKRLKVAERQLDDLQRLLLANKTWSLLLVFQGMDASGKDSTIRAVMSGISPTGCQVFNFKRPTRTELAHDFLWRTSRSLPERGRIGIFNRSQYEEVLVVRVHPEILESQRLPYKADSDEFWNERLESIRNQEQHLARNGVAILKFWLNISKDEQKDRFLSRLDEPRKNWKFNPDDVAERQHWDRYMHAYEEALNATSRPWAPWYAIPADSKPYMRAAIAEIIVRSLSSLNLRYPEPDATALVGFGEAREKLQEE